MFEGKPKSFYIMLTVAAILVVAVLAYLGFLIYNGQLSLLPGPQGFLLMTLTPRVENATTSVYMYNFGDKKLRLFDNKRAEVLSGYGLPSGLAVASVHLLESDATEANLYQLYQLDMKSNFAVKPITNSWTFLKRHPELTPDGKQVAFMAKQSLSDTATSSEPDSWSIYITDLNGSEKLIGPGVYPQWSPDGKKILALRSSGLYLYDLEKPANNTTVWGTLGGPAVMRMSIDVSRDGSWLAWSVPKDRRVLLAKISSWEPFEAKTYKTIDNVLAFWPVFSPDAKYVAVITGEEKDNQVANPYVAAYNTENLKSQKVLDLDPFFIHSMTLTDWGILK